MKIRVVLKIATYTSVILLCVGFAFSLYYRMSKTEKTEDFNLYTLVPQDAIAVIDTDNVVDLLNSINELDCSKDNRFLNFSRLFSQLKAHINTLEDETPHGFSRQMNKMLVSFHEPDNEMNQVFYCRLGVGDKDLIERFVRQYSVSTFPQKYFDYKGEEIRIYPMPDDKFISCYLTSDFLAVSYQKRLIESVIDTRLAGNSILGSPNFPKVGTSSVQRHASAVIYVQMHPLTMGEESEGASSQILMGGWTEFNMQMNSNLIYFTGVSHDNDSTLNFVNVLRRQQLVEGFPGEVLPSSTFHFSRSSISDVQSMFVFSSGNEYIRASYPREVMDRDSELIDFLSSYSKQSITTCMFGATDSLLSPPHTVAHIPVTNAVRAERFIRNFPQATHATHRAGSKSYRVYALPPNTILTQFAGVSTLTPHTYVCFYKGNMLMSPDTHSIMAYITDMDTGNVLEDEPVYEAISASLSDSYCFMSMTDLGVSFEQSEYCTRLIPGFFFRNREFFKHFVFSAQFTCVEDVVYPNIVLLYKSEETPAVPSA